MVAVVTVCLVGYALLAVWIWVRCLGMDADKDRFGIYKQGTILTAFRNEAAHLLQLHSDLAGMPSIYYATKPLVRDWGYDKEGSDDEAMPPLLKQPLRWIAIDDGSTDNGAALLAEAKGNTNLFQVAMLHTPAVGKRQALALGNKLVETDYILQVDADCRVGIFWCEQALAVANRSDADLVIMPLRFRGKRSFWLDLINTEFAAVMAVTCGMARSGHPVMCNGANLLYSKRLWVEAESYLLSRRSTGGDDMYLLDFALAHGFRVVYSDAPSLWVDTEAPGQLSDFLRQRQRWAGKGVGYKQKAPMAVAFVLLTGQLAFAIGLWGSLLGWIAWPGYWMLAKVLVEGGLIRTQLQKAGLRFNLWAFLLWQVLYVPYLIAVLLPTFAGRKPVWKS